MTFLKNIRFNFLHSKVARRIFLLFIISSIIPLSVMAYFSIHEVSFQLNKQASDRLHHTSKAAGMNVIKRLLDLETDLKTIISVLLKNGAIEEFGTEEFHIFHEGRFKHLVILGENNKIIASHGIIHDMPKLNRNEIAHLNDGKTILYTNKNKGDYAQIFMLRKVLMKDSSNGIICGEIFTEYLWENKDYLPDMTNLFVVDEKIQVIYSSTGNHIPLIQLENAMTNKTSKRSFKWNHDNEIYIAGYWTSFMRPQFMANWTLIHSQPETYIMGPLNKFQNIFILVISLSFLIVIYFSLSQIRKSLVPIGLLQSAIKNIKLNNFTDRVQIKSNDEFRELGSAFNAMTESLEKRMADMTMINSIGIALSSEKKTDQMLKSILEGAKKMLNADFGILYSITKDKKLEINVLSIDSLKLNIDKSSERYNSLIHEIGDIQSNTVASYSVFKNAVTNYSNIYDVEGFYFIGDDKLDKAIGYKSKSCLSVPMLNHDKEVVGVLQLINKINDNSPEIVSFTDEDRNTAENLASMAAVSHSKNKMLEDFKLLFNSMIELIATAIDEKSSHTGSHCRRVPYLTMMIAEAVCNSKSNHFRHFSMTDEELYELKVAAFLHDCGKLGIPTHIEEKSTKLQIIFDQINLIDTRFEILERDAEISLLRKKLSARDDNNISTDIAKELVKYKEQIRYDKEFLHVCNEGRVNLDSSHLAKLKEITQKYKWHEDSGKERSILSENELYYLSVPRGTITKEERNIINSHVTTSTKLLKSLHYPKSLENVPEFASVHHERMDGLGYPNGLTQDQIPIQGRIIAIADIFEALTGERPYKKKYTLSEALQILDSMSKSGHIDPDLYKLFVEEKIYLPFAEKYLSPDQIDEVVISGQF